MNLDTSKDITTDVEVNTSPRASTEDAFNADEFIFSPTNLLNLERIYYFFKR